MSLQSRLLQVLSYRGLARVASPWLNARTWTVEVGEATGLKIGLPQNRDYVFGTAELPVQRAMASGLGPGDVFFDVGANVGFFSMLAARLVGPAGAVYAFEPVAGNAAAIRRNAGLNEFDSVHVCEVAAGAASGTATLLLTDWDGGGALASSAVAPPDPTGTVSVQVVSLDDYVTAQGLPAPAFIKIDVEGVEMDVLEGMRQLIADGMPTILCEVDDSDRAPFHERWNALDAVLRGYGYEVSRLDDSYPNSEWFVGHSIAFAPGRVIRA